MKRSAIQVVPDVLVGLAELVRTFVRPGGAIVVSPPCYDRFYALGKLVGRDVVDAPLTTQGRLDLDVIEDTFAAFADADRPACYLLCNPQNPTATVHTAQDLGGLADLAGRYGIPVLSDEIHAPLVQANEVFTPYLSVAGDSLAVAITSAAKAWNLASYKAAVVVTGERTAAQVGDLNGLSGAGLSHLGLVAQTAAFNDGEDWLDQALVEIAMNHRIVTDLVETLLPSIRLSPLPATYLMWLDCRPLALNDDPSDFFRRHGGVALGRGPSYGAPGDGFARMNVATSPQVLRDAVQRMARAARHISI